DARCRPSHPADAANATSAPASIRPTKGRRIQRPSGLAEETGLDVVVAVAVAVGAGLAVGLGVAAGAAEGSARCFTYAGYVPSGKRSSMSLYARCALPRSPLAHSVSATPSSAG